MRILSKFKGRRAFLGVDVGGFSVKVAEACQEGDVIKVLSFGQARIPEDVVVDGLVQNDEVFISTLKELLSNLSPQSHSVNLGLYAYTALYDRISIEINENQDLSQVVREEIEAFIPFDINEIYYDYFPLLHEDKTEIIFAATKKEYVDHYLEVFSKVGLSVNSVDVDVFAVSNLLEYLYGPSTRMVVDIGATKVLTFFSDKQGPLFSREIAVGLNSITKEISEKLEVSLEEAERLRFQIPNDERGQVVKEAYTRFLEELRTEVENSINIYRGKYYKDPEEAYLIGGGAFIPGIVEFLKERIFVPFKEVELRDRLSFSEKFDPNYINEINKLGVVTVAHAVSEFLI